MGVGEDKRKGARLRAPVPGASRPSSEKALQGANVVAQGPPEAPASATQKSAAAAKGPRIGPLPCAPGESPFRIKGVYYRGLLHHIASTVGVEAFLKEVSDPNLAHFAAQPFLASIRYDVFPFVPLLAAHARALGTPFEALIQASTAVQVRYDAKTTYKLILDVDEPEEIIERIGRFNAAIYNFGKFSATCPEKNRVWLAFEEIPAYIEPWFSPMHIAYSVESLRLAGAEGVRVLSRLAEDAGSHRGFPLRTYRTELHWDRRDASP